MYFISLVCFLCTWVAPLLLFIEIDLLIYIYIYIYIKGTSVFLKELVLLPSSNYARSGSIVHCVAPTSGQQSI